MGTSSRTFERPVPVRSTDHEVVERVDAPRYDDRVMSRYFCRECHRQEDALVWFIRDPCPDA